MAYGRIPGTFGGGANTPDAAPAVEFSTPENPLAGISPTTSNTDIPGTYEDGAANTQRGRANPFTVGYFDGSNSIEGDSASGGAGETPPSERVNGVCLNGWGYMK